MRLALALALLVPITARGLDRWTTEDAVTEAVFVGVTAIDWAQTRTALADGRGELNPIIGHHPSRARLDVMVGAAVLGHALVSRLLPQPYRIVWQYVTIAGELGVVSRNHFEVGVRVHF